MAPICVNCQIKMTFPRSGVYVLETYEDGEKPYKVWSADLYICKACGHQVITGFGQNPLCQQFDNDFGEWVTKCEFKFK